MGLCGDSASCFRAKVLDGEEYFIVGAINGLIVLVTVCLIVLVTACSTGDDFPLRGCAKLAGPKVEA